MTIMTILYDAILYPTPRLAIEEIVDRSGTFVEQIVGGHVTEDNLDEYVERVWPELVDAFDASDGDAELTEDDLRTYLAAVLAEGASPHPSIVIDGESEYDESEAVGDLVVHHPERFATQAAVAEQAAEVERLRGVLQEISTVLGYLYSERIGDGPPMLPADLRHYSGPLRIIDRITHEALSSERRT
jgi:hypothetical protein